jgi:hypothetical protein
MSLSKKGKCDFWHRPIKLRDVAKRGQCLVVGCSRPENFCQRPITSRFVRILPSSILLVPTNFHCQKSETNCVSFELEHCGSRLDLVDSVLNIHTESVSRMRLFPIFDRLWCFLNNEFSNFLSRVLRLGAILIDILYL